MSAQVIKTADGSLVVFDKISKEAYVLPPRSVKAKDAKDPASALLAAQGVVAEGKGTKLTRSQLEALALGLSHVALLGGTTSG